MGFHGFLMYSHSLYYVYDMKGQVSSVSQVDRRKKGEGSRAKIEENKSRSRRWNSDSSDAFRFSRLPKNPSRRTGGFDEMGYYRGRRRECDLAIRL